MRDALVNLVAKKTWNSLPTFVLNACRVMNTQDEEVANNFLYPTIVKTKYTFGTKYTMPIELIILDLTSSSCSCSCYTSRFINSLKTLYLDQSNSSLLV